jgi:hypothetical protein
MYVKTGLLLIVWAIVAVSGWCTEVPAQRSYMYVGGQYILNEAGQHVFTDQMYVEKLTPAAGVTKPHPIVFIHGQAQTGTVRIMKAHFFSQRLTIMLAELAQQARRRKRLGLLLPV